MAVTIALDLRYLQAACRSSPSSGLGGAGVYSRGLWSALATRRPDWRYIAVGDRGAVPEAFRAVVDVGDPTAIAPRGVAGLCPFPLRLSQSRYGWMLSALESELGLGSTARKLPYCADVLHGLSQLPPPRRAGPASVLTIYDLIPLGATGTQPRSVAARARRTYASLIRRAERFVCISESTRRDLLAMTGVDPRRAVVAYPGIDTATFRAVHCTDDELRDRYGLRRPYFLNVGVCFGRKNPGILLDAFAKVTATRDGRECSLAFVGPYHVIAGSQHRIERHADDLGVAAGVKVIGGVDDADLARLYTNATALVFPSLYEGFGYPALEALACGTPAIVSDVSSLPEAVGTLGRLVNPRDPIQIARAMIDRLNELPGGRLEAAGADWASRFSWDATARVCIAAYEELIG